MEENYEIFQEYLEKMKRIQGSILKYIDEESMQVINLSHLMKLLDDLNIRNNKYDLNLTLHLIVSIANNHHRGPDFFDKIDKILKKLKKEILHFFSNRTIFSIFKSNNRILLFLIENEILVVDKIIVSFLNKDFRQYLFKQVKQFINKEERIEISKSLPFFYEEFQKVGEDQRTLFNLIREDNLDEFISYSEKKTVRFDVSYGSSMFETNQLLFEKYFSLIEYAAFHGSIKILKYIHQKGVEFEPSLWLYAIHSRNIELINFLKDNHVKLTGEIYKKCIRESIKCHHNDILSIIGSNDENAIDVFTNSLEFYNFDLLKYDKISGSSFFNLCKYDYYFFVNILLNDAGLDRNNLIILNQII